MKASVMLGTLACVCSLTSTFSAGAWEIDPEALGLEGEELLAFQAEMAAIEAEKNGSGAEAVTVAAAPAAAPAEAAEITATVAQLPAAAPAGDKIRIGITLPTQNIEHLYKEGQFLTQAFEKEGYEVSLYYAGDNDLEIQQRQISRMINEGCKAIIVGAVDCYGLDQQLDEARAKGVKVISYGSLIMNSDAVDFMVAFDARRVGEIQGNYLRSSLKLDKASADNPRTIELFSGVAADSNSREIFEGALSVLRPYMDSGVLVVRSGETAFEDTCVGRSDEDAIRRMDALIARQGYAPEGTRLDAVLSPSDVASAGIITALKRAGYNSENMPRITGRDCAAIGVHNIEQGMQDMSVFKDGRVLANSTLRMTAAMLNDEVVRITNPGIENGVKQIPAYECLPVYVAGGRDQYADLMVKSGYLTRAEIENPF